MKNKGLVISVFSLYLVLSLIVILDVKYLIFKNNDSAKLLDVYQYNFKNIIVKNEIFTTSELKMIKEIEKINPYNVIINSIIGMPYQKVWITAWFWKDKINSPCNHIYSYLSNNYYFNPNDDTSFNYMSKQYKYFLIFYRQNNPFYYLNDNHWYLNNNQKLYRYSTSNYTILRNQLCYDCNFYNFDAGMLIEKK